VSHPGLIKAGADQVRDGVLLSIGFLSTPDRGSLEEKSSFNRLPWILNRLAVAATWTNPRPQWTHGAGQERRGACISLIVPYSHLRRSRNLKVPHEARPLRPALPCPATKTSAGAAPGNREGFARAGVNCWARAGLRPRACLLWLVCVLLVRRMAACARTKARNAAYWPNTCRTTASGITLPTGLLHGRLSVRMTYGSS
jgi:hypothetical protein